MKDEALKLADELQEYMTSLGWQTHQAPAMIRRLVEELDKLPARINKEDGLVCAKCYGSLGTQPLSDEEITALHLKCWNEIEFARAIEERHGIK
jgi:hypothetical protein